MRWRLLAFGLVLLSGCGQSSPAPSPTLERYDRMRRELDWLTAASGRVAADAQALRVAMSWGNVTAIRARAVRLKSDAVPFSLRAGAAGNATRNLAATAPAPTVRRYLQLVTATLSAQWVEGVALRAVAEQAWYDPLSIRGNDAQRLAADVSWAGSAARRAVLAAEAARRLRARSPAAFRYPAPTPAT